MYPAVCTCTRKPVRFGGLTAMLLLVSAAGAAGASDVQPGCGVLLLPMRSGQVTYTVGRTFIHEDSDSAWTGSGGLVRGRDYVLDRIRGELRLLREPVEGDTIRLSACWMLSPPPIDLQLNTYRPLSGEEPDSTGLVPPGAGAPRRPSTGRSTQEAPRGASMNITGNKTIAVDFGASQDAFLRQSLDLAVSGTLAPGVELTGVLSDRNTPVSASGTTQDLQSLERVLIELRAPQGAATLGDLSIDVTEGEFARVQRRLKGVAGEFRQSAVRVNAAAASAEGEYHRMQFIGEEGRQGPYVLTDRDGNPGVSIVAESEVVIVDGERMVRGESADYFIDYERAELTFTNRRPITFASRVTVEYQYTVNRYRRNLATAGGRWSSGAFNAFTQIVTEGDDRGRPLDFELSPGDIAALQDAGDSLAFIGNSGVTPGGGDYDSVRVGGELVYAYVGSGLGQFSVRFTRVGDAQGDYTDSTVVSGQTVFGFVGPGQGAYAVGRPLPLPEARQVWSAGGGTRVGVLSVDVEGAMSRHDRNTYSSIDDEDNVGHAGRATVALEGTPGGIGQMGLALEARSVGEQFDPFVRLEAPFAQEDWGLPINADIDHQDRVLLRGHLRPRIGGELLAHAGKLETPFGFSSFKRGVQWSNSGFIGTRAFWERADGTQEGVAFADGGRERLLGEVRVRLPWVEPLLRGASDERRFPSDSGLVGDRFREATVELRSSREIPWLASAGLALRRDARLTGAGFEDQADTRTARFGLESPRGAAVGAALRYQRREVTPIADPRRTRSDLASVRLRADDRQRGVRTLLNVEVTSEGENRRTRVLTFVGNGRGAYDEFGNFVGTGDYELQFVTSSALDRISRTATSTHLAWTFGAKDLQGSRISFDFESEARRRGEFLARDAFVSPGAALTDPAFARAGVLQRLETDFAPASRFAAIHVRAERRVSSDRVYENFAQTLDERQLSARWRARPGAATSTELEARTQKQIVSQVVVGGATLDRTLISHTGTGQLIYSPHPRIRAVAAAEAQWSRPEGQTEYTRTLRIGPDLGLSVGAKGRLELRARRGFVEGQPNVLLPTADPLGVPRWDGTARFDYRIRQSVTFGISYAVRDFEGRRVQSTGRSELRAFF